MEGWLLLLILDHATAERMPSGILLHEIPYVSHLSVRCSHEACWGRQMRHDMIGGTLSARRSGPGINRIERGTINMTDSRLRLMLVISFVSIAFLFVFVLGIGKRVRILDGKLRDLSRRIASMQQAGSSDPTGQLRSKVAEQQVVLMSINKSLHREDLEKYGDAINVLYHQARAGHHGNGNSTDRTKSKEALSKLLQDYPQANATGMVIAELALEAAMQARTADAKSYFDKLSNNLKFRNIVTDMGVEAYPALLIYLTSQYIAEGHPKQAEELIRQLEGDYGNKFVAARGSKGEVEWKLGSEVSQALLEQLAGFVEGSKGVPPLRQ